MIQSRRGFASFVKRSQFTTYVDYVIRPSYEIHRDMGLLKYSMDGMKLEEDMSFRNFFSGRILWDESMACNAYKWTVQNQGGLLIGLVGADHSKFIHIGLIDSFKNKLVSLTYTLHNVAILLFGTTECSGFVP
jgi:Haem-binding uptake, Tiki superfamily, ChaN